ncbi:MAG: LysM peptidoglycan-binding domain-containing protein [Firmicutes bacterium]|nr:LysM peptidoglycan-binding domain-containing protein [Bacillota bacterium]
MKYRIVSVFLLLLLVLAFTGRHLAAEDGLIERFDFVEADLRDILRSIGMAGKITVLLTKDVTGTYSLYIREPMSVRDALERVARTYEYDLRWLNPEKTVVVIGKPETLKQNFDVNMLQTRVFTLRYSAVNEIAEALKIVVDPAKMSLNPRTNQIAITASPLQIENAAEIIAQMDHPMPQVNIEARMEEIVESSMEELGLTWSSSFSFVLSPGFSILSAPELAVKLNVLHQQNKAVTLAQPNATCLDSQQATIFIGDKYPVARRQVSEGKEVWSVEYTDIGTKLVIKPRVNKDKVVTVYVTAEVSSILEYKDLGEAGTYPVIRTRSTESLARLRDGQTFVLTGLVQRDDKTEQTGIPILDRLPILSALFKNKKTEYRSTVICLFLTPRIQPLTEEELDKKAGSSSSGLEGGQQKKDQATAATKEKTTVQETGITGEVVPSPEESSLIPGEETAAPEMIPEEIAPSPSPSPGSFGEIVPAVTPAPTPEPTPSPGGEVSPEETATKVEVAPEVPVSPSPAEGEMIFPLVLLPLPTEPAPPAEAAPTEPPRPSPSPAPSPSVPTVPMRPEELKEVLYTVKKGDTLYSIGKKFGVEVKKIAEYNNLKSSSVLHPDQVLRIPIPDDHKYVVKPRETLWRIAKRYGVSVELLAEINGISDPAKLEVGQVLVLPCPVSRTVNPEF